MGLLHLLEGNQTLGRGRRFWLLACALLFCAMAFGVFGDGFSIENGSYFLVWVFMALGLAMMWGLAGTMSFGQTAFFGIGGYGYAVIAINWGETPAATIAAAIVALAIVIIAATVVGYFIFYGGVKGVLVSIITLALTLGLETFLSQTAGSKWAIGNAELGGFNGVSSMPPLALPWLHGSIALSGRILYFVLVVGISATYLALRMVANSRLGTAFVAVRENPTRAEALGYNVKALLCGSFVLGSALAGVSGVMYTTWGQYISPDTMGLSAAAMPIIWVAVSGRDLTATLLGTLVLLLLSQQLAVYGTQYALVALGVILIISMLRWPLGLIDTPLRLLLSLNRARVPQTPASPLVLTQPGKEAS